MMWFLMMYASSLLLVGCAQTRIITGTIRNSSTGKPVPGLKLALIRNPMNYGAYYIPMILVGVPQPVVLSETSTNGGGVFRFSVRSKRELIISPFGEQPKSTIGHLEADMKDSVGMDDSFDPDRESLPVKYRSNGNMPKTKQTIVPK